MGREWHEDGPRRRAEDPPGRAILAVLALVIAALVVAVVVIVAALLTASPLVPPAPVTSPTPRPHYDEDDPLWRCDLDGDRTCGPALST